MQPPPSDQIIESIKQALFARQKIEAIKIFREHRNCGLAEAKNAIDKLEAELLASSPEKFAPAPSAPPRLLLFLAFILFLIILGVLFFTRRVPAN
jgi:hypothetical protein